MEFIQSVLIVYAFSLIVHVLFGLIDSFQYWFFIKYFKGEDFEHRYCKKCSENLC